MNIETKEQLRQLLGHCDPSRPLPATDEKFYVPRTSTFREIVREHLFSNEFARVLISGQSGVGKSTELMMLVKELKKDKFFSLMPPIEKYLDLEVMNWQDMIVFSALHWASDLTFSEGVVTSFDISDVIMELGERLGGLDVLEFFFGSIRDLCRLAKGYDLQEEPFKFREGEYSEVLPEEIKILNDLEEVKHFFQTSFGTVHENLLRNSRRAIEVSTAIFQVASGNHYLQRPKLDVSPSGGGWIEVQRLNVVTIIDGTEKLSLDQAIQLFYRQGRVAMKFPSRLLVVVPLEMCYEEAYEQIREQFTDHVFLRAIACQGEDKVAQRGKEFFRKMLSLRLGDLSNELINWRAVDKAIRHSAGVPRQFLMIVQHAVHVAISESLSTVDFYCISRGIEKARERFYYQLGQDDLKTLAEFSGRKERGQEFRRLHRLTCLVEVENGGIELIMNPLCEPFLQNFLERHPECRVS